MPWVNEDLCISCGVCVDDCSVGAITLKDDQKAAIQTVANQSKLKR